MTSHRIGTREEWASARAQLLAREKDFTRMGDELARQRQDLPWVKVEKEYQFETEDGPKTLVDLFDGTSQLAVYQFMFGPHYDGGGCPSCSSTADSFDGVLTHLDACDVTMICVSRAPLEQLLAYRERMGWNFNWVSSYEIEFNVDYGVSAAGDTAHDAAPPLEANELAVRRLLDDQPSVRDSLPSVALQNARATGTSPEGYFTEGHGFTTFALEEDTVYHCYSTYARGTEFLMGYYAILDRVPKGRAEGNQPASWLRRHDEYDSLLDPV